MFLMAFFGVSAAISLINLALIGVMKAFDKKTMDRLDRDEKTIFKCMIFAPGFSICVLVILVSFSVTETSKWVAKKLKTNKQNTGLTIESKLIRSK